MKRIFLLTILLGIGLMDAHSQTVYYGYDAAGNRVIRTIDIEEVGEAPPDDDDEEAIVEKSADARPLGISVYPNPTSQKVYVQIDEEVDDQSESLFEKRSFLLLSDPDGRILEKRRVVQSLNEFDIQNNSQGIYILRLMVGKEERRAWRIIKK